MPRAKFPAYRRYREACIAASDALMALLIGARLGGHNLSTSAADPSARLPDLFGRIAGIGRVNRTVGDAARLLEEAEAHLASMGIPYVVGVHGAFLGDVIQMLRDDGKDEESTPRSIEWRADVNDIQLHEIHEYFAERCGRPLPSDLLAVFHLARRIRNRIIHFGGEAGPRLLGEYRTLPRTAKDGWEAIAGRPLTVNGGKVVLSDGELIAVLALTRHLGQAVNDALVTTLSRGYWARLLVEDYRRISPGHFGERAQRMRRLMGHARACYAPIALTEGEIEAAL